MAVETTERPASAPEGHWRNPCHLLTDDRSSALCGADISGRRVHNLRECMIEGHAICEWCEAVEAVLG